MTSHRSEPSSRDYEREAKATRHRLAESLDELSDRLTPGQVFDEMLTYAKGGGGTFFRALTNAARENPVPSLLISAGCMMFLSEKMGMNRFLGRSDGADGRSVGSGAAETVSDAASGAAGTVSKAVDSVRSGVRSATGYASEQASSVAEGMKRGAETIGETVSGASQRVKDTAANMRDRGGDATDKLKQTAAEVGGTIKEYSDAIGEQVAETADQTRRQASRAARQVKEKATSLINEQPLIFAAMGLAVGAAIAAALPSTDTEDELMGEASDAVKEAVTEVASDQYETAKAAAGTVVQEAKSIAEREGLTPSAASDVARNVAEKLKRVVTETGAAAGSEVRDFAKVDDKT